MGCFCCCFLGFFVVGFFNVVFVCVFFFFFFFWGGGGGGGGVADGTLYQSFTSLSGPNSLANKMIKYINMKVVDFTCIKSNNRRKIPC